jgi:hypothetical protein
MFLSQLPLFGYFSPMPSMPHTAKFYMSRGRSIDVDCVSNLYGTCLLQLICLTTYRLSRFDKQSNSFTFKHTIR